MGPVRSVVAEHYKQLPPVWWKEPKKHDLRATLLQSRNPPLALGQTCGLKQALPNNAKTICLRVPYLMHWCFLQFEVPEMMWVQLIKHGVFICRHTWGWYCPSYGTAWGLVADHARCRKRMGIQIQKCPRLTLATCRKSSVVRTTFSRTPESVLEKITSLNAIEWKNNKCSVHDQWNRTR